MRVDGIRLLCRLTLTAARGFEVLSRTLFWAVLLACLAAPGTAVTLGVSRDGAHFTIEGKPTFLNGISYYAGTTVSTPDFLTRDLDDMVRNGVNWIRVWATWDLNENLDSSTVAIDGSVREPYMSRLKTIVRECNRRKMIVDVTMHRGKHPAPSVQAEHLACAKTLAAELKPYRNVYFDMGNERDVMDTRFVSYADMGELISAVKAIDPKRLCTASGVPDSKDDLDDYLTKGHCDFIAPHLGRDKGDPARTLGTVTKFIGWMKGLGKRVPVHLQEPFRQDYARYQPTAEDYYRDAGGGKIAGAAGWCLHNGSTESDPNGRPHRSFLMNDAEGRLFAQLNKLELEVVANMREQIGGTSPDTLRYQAEYDEQMSHASGRKDGLAWAATPGEDKPGYLCSGLAVKPVLSGRCRVTCRLAGDGQAEGDTEVAVIQVLAGDKQVGSKAVRASDLAGAGKWREFSLNFTAQNGPTDVRVNWPGKSALKLDWVTIAASRH